MSEEDAVINGIAGAGGGIIAQILTYPLQTVSTRQQTSSNKDEEEEEEEEGGGLYAGLAPSLVGTAASEGVYYYFYQIFKNKASSSALVRGGDGSVGMIQSLLVAALSGCLNVLLTNPIWVVVTRIQTHKKTPTSSSSSRSNYGTMDAIQELFQEAGVWGLWKGVAPTLIMVSNPSIQFMLYETFSNKLKQKHTSENMKDGAAHRLTSIEIFFLGAVAKLGATVATYPVNVVKSRLQAKQGADDNRHNYKGTIDAVTKIVRYEGVSGLYHGMGTKIVQSVLAAAVLFMVKEELVKAARLLLTADRRLINKSKIKPP